MSDRIFFREIAVFARHGVFSEEASLGQRFEIDVDCFLDVGPYARTDNHRAAVDYGKVYATIMAVAERERFWLIEALAERIAGRLLDEFPLDRVRVEVRKPGAPVPGIFGTVGVEVTRHREGS
jgi:7,8-dihydroneopterin aldolase/epimerase/oxygenase